MNTSLSNDSDLIFFGRFEEKVVFILFRNWIILDLIENTSVLIPIGPLLFLESSFRSLKISWKALGFNFSLKSDKAATKFFFPGELHNFNIQSNNENISVSSFETPRATFDLKNDLAQLKSRNSKAQLITFPNSSFDVNFICYPTQLKSDKCLVYLHGGPFQRFTNEHNSLLKQINDFGFPIYVPQYCGDPTIDNSFLNERPDSDLQLAQLSLFLMQLKQKYKNIYCLAHSYGCYLGKHLLDESSINGLISLNGIFDLETLKLLAPVTFANSDNFKTDTTPAPPNPWLHIHSKSDSVVPISYLHSSLIRIGCTPHRIEMLETSEHEILEQSQQDAVASYIHAFINDAKL